MQGRRVHWRASSTATAAPKPSCVGPLPAQLALHTRKDRAPWGFTLPRGRLGSLPLGLVQAPRRLTTFRWLPMWIRILSSDIRARCSLAVAPSESNMGALLGNQAHLAPDPGPEYPFSRVTSLGFPGGSDSKEFPCSAGDTGVPGLIPGSGRSPGGGNGNPLQHSCLENSMDRGAWWATVHGVAKSRTLLSD